MPKQKRRMKPGMALRLLILFVLTTGMISLIGCDHYKPMAFPPQNGEREKPGLFSGKTGAFEIPLGKDENVEGITSSSKTPVQL